MTFEEYMDAVTLEYVLHMHKGPNRWRWGQTCSNVLFRVRPELHNAVRYSTIDPWNTDSMMDPTFEAFIRFIKECW